ncbi:MAG: hypothetical protein JOY66_10065 [Acetobacteraceae bacterium]|nr:hypothetical protein [Acetobacteraceae bacterium]
MSNEVNITETFFGTMDPGEVLQLFDWSGNYDQIRAKARFFSVSPDPLIPFDGGTIEFEPNQLNLEITRVWNTVWVDVNGNATFQRNVEITNIGGSTAAFHLLRAETDN